jgi:hypothetical protein
LFFEMHEILFFEMIYYFWTNRRVRTHSLQIFDKRRAHLYYVL